MIRGFIQFIREQGVVGLAVGFLLGGAISKLVSAFVGDIIQPLIGIALGKAELTTLALHVRGVELKFGDFISVLIDFLIIAAVVYWGFKFLKLDQVDVKKE
jgi:large conductance mechanosensitive channel